MSDDEMTLRCVGERASPAPDVERAALWQRSERCWVCPPEGNWFTGLQVETQQYPPLHGSPQATYPACPDGSGKSPRSNPGPQ